MNQPAGSSAVNLIPVRMGEMAYSRSTRDVLSVVGLGSCVAAALIAPQKRAAALAHVVLPEARMAGGHAAPPAKFADTAVVAMLEQLREFDIHADDLYAVLVGGATMFGHGEQNLLAGVGDRNVEAVREQLAVAGIGIASEDVGGISGRSLQLALNDLRVFVRSGANKPFEMSGSPKPIAVKVPANEDDQQLEPFPDDIWSSGQIAS